MRVILDTGFLSLSPSGTGVYVAALRDHLPAAAARLGTNLDLVNLAPPAPLTSRGRRLLWESVGPALATWWRGGDALHVPHQQPPVLPLPHGTASVFTVHDMIPYRLPEYQRGRINQIRLAMATRILRRADRLIAPSEATARDITTLLGVERDRVAVIPLAAGPQYRPPTHDDVQQIDGARARFGIAGRYVFNVGGYDARKNLALLIEAFAAAIATDDPALSDSTLVIGGAPHSGNLAVFPPVEPVIRRFGLERRVILTGRLTDTELVALHQGAAAYCTPSSYEGFGLTPLEAMACGVPVIVTNETSLPEVVGDTGLIVQGDVGSIAAALRQVLTNPDLAADLRRKGVDRAATFTWPRTADATLAVYLDAALGHKRFRR